MPTARLLSPYALAGLNLPNRVVMAPLTRNRAGNNGVPTEMNACYYAQRSSAGLIISEASYVVPEGAGEVFTPGIHTDLQQQGWQRVTQAVHDRGGRIFLQLWHAGSRTPVELLPAGDPARAPSDIYRENGTKARGMSVPEVRALVDAYARAAIRAKNAGFDGVEIHSANGYLLQQFLCDATNRRRDCYGGSHSNKIRFLLEIIEATIEVWGPGRVGVRLSPPASRDYRYWDSKPEQLFENLVSELNRQQVSYLHIVQPVKRRRWRTNIDAAFFRGRFGGSLIACRDFTFLRGERILRQNDADLVAFGRLFVSNPDLPERFSSGAHLNTWNESTFHTQGPSGYIDYPPLKPEAMPDPASTRERNNKDRS